MVVWDPNEIWGGLEPDAVEARAHHPVEGPLLGAHAVHRAADREHPRAASGRSRHRPPRGAVGSRAGRRRLRVDRVHHQPGEGEPGRIGLGGRHRDSPRQPPRARGAARTAPCSRSISSAASARRCSACRRTICCGSSRGWSAGEVHNRIVVPTTRSTGRRSRSTACCPSSSSPACPSGGRVRSPVAQSTDSSAGSGP